MKLDDKIDYFNDNIDDDKINKEALLFKNKLNKKGNIFFISGSLLTIISFIIFVVLTIIYIIKKELSLFQLIPFTLMVLFSILIVVGIFYKKLAQAIIIDSFQTEVVW